MYCQSFFKPALNQQPYFHIEKDQVSLSLAIEADVDELGKVARKTFEETYTHGYYTKEALDKKFDQTFLKKTLPEELGNNKNNFLILKMDHHIIGFAKLILNRPCAQLDKIYVLKAHQGKGFGKLLMENCIRLAVEAGCQNMTLIVYKGNEKAISFYQKYGFMPTGDEYIFKNPVSGEDTPLRNIKMQCDTLTLSSTMNPCRKIG